MANTRLEIVPAGAGVLGKGRKTPPDWQPPNPISNNISTTVWRKFNIKKVYDFCELATIVQLLSFEIVNFGQRKPR